MDPQVVLSTLKKLEPQARTLLVAVSGGGDSVALLRLLLEGSYSLHAAHFDHALRPESGEDARFVVTLCDGLKVPIVTERTAVGPIARAKGWNLEDAARRLRYSFLTRAAKRVGADLIVTAHTRDDQAETVLLQLLRGAAYLQGMPARRGSIARPLLGVTRAELRLYLRGLGQPWLEDASNTDAARTRAWLRHEIIPLLEARYPALKRTLTRLADVQRDTAAYLEHGARPFVKGGSVDARALSTRPPALQRTVLGKLLQDAGVAPDAQHLEELRQALSARRPVRISLPGNRLARLVYGTIKVLPAPTVTKPQRAEAALELPAEVDPNRLSAFPPLFYRTRVAGDRIRLTGGSKKLSDLLIDAKVPREHRDALRLLATDPVGPSDILWVEGVGTDVRVAKFLPDPDTRFMRQALELAQGAAAAGEVPVGAIVARGDEILARAANTSRAENDPTAHAELKALRDAARKLGDWRLEGCTLYVTLEPCPMCFGAALTAHLPRVVYGARNHREGALGGVADLQQHDWKRGLEVRGGVLSAEAERLLGRFFGSRREAFAEDVHVTNSKR